MPDTQSGKNSPAGFAAGAAAGLSQVSGQLSGAQTAAATGNVTLSPDAALALLHALDGLQSRADDLVKFTSGKLDQPLHLGHNWVGQAMDTKLRGMVNGHSGAVQPVLTQFQQVLDQVSATVRQAAGLTQQTDADTARALRNASGQAEEV